MSHASLKSDGEGVRMGDGKFCFAIDRGGTFADVYAICPGNKVRTMKLLSVDPSYGDAPTEGIRRILEEVSENAFGVMAYSTFHAQFAFFIN